MKKKLFRLFTAIFDLYSLGGRIVAIKLENGDVLNVKWKPKRKKATLRMDFDIETRPSAFTPPFSIERTLHKGGDYHSVVSSVPFEQGQEMIIPVDFSGIGQRIAAHMTARQAQISEGEELAPGAYAVSNVGSTADGQGLEGDVHISDTETRRIRLGENPFYRSTLINLAIAFRDLGTPAVELIPTAQPGLTNIAPLYLEQARRVIQFCALRDQLIDTLINSFPSAKDETPKDLEELITALKEASAEFGRLSALGGTVEGLEDQQLKIDVAEEELCAYLSNREPNPDYGKSLDESDDSVEIEVKRANLTDVAAAADAAGILEPRSNPYPFKGLDFADIKSEGMEPRAELDPLNYKPVAELNDDPMPPLTSGVVADALDERPPVDKDLERHRVKSLKKSDRQIPRVTSDMLNERD